MDFIAAMLIHVQTNNIIPQTLLIVWNAIQIVNLVSHMNIIV